eukprot:TRINITY_DN2032_c0_g1_i5.p1 TRINITY_DN2032_c0_g1~~TRINITY_DN2032_c0_g1_i5.p1  ORF type:complete len:192 (+),score=12.03 TRINITY_DN2032_c0_g1_i5:43-618(+)
MIIHYLQRVEPPVLPFLQKLHLSGEGKTTVQNERSECMEVMTNGTASKIETEAILQESKEVPILEDSIPTKSIKTSKPLGKFLYFEQDLEMVRKYMHEMYGTNAKTVSELLCSFFEYYSFNFDRSKYKVNIKSTKQIPKNKYAEISIKDPFDRSHDPGAAVEAGSSNGQQIFAKFREAYSACLGARFRLPQ